MQKAQQIVSSSHIIGMHWKSHGKNNTKETRIRGREIQSNEKRAKMFQKTGSDRGVIAG